MEQLSRTVAVMREASWRCAEFPPRNLVSTKSTAHKSMLHIVTPQVEKKGWGTPSRGRGGGATTPAAVQPTVFVAVPMVTHTVELSGGVLIFCLNVAMFFHPFSAPILIPIQPRSQGSISRPICILWLWLIAEVIIAVECGHSKDDLLGMFKR